MTPWHIRNLVPVLTFLLVALTMMVMSLNKFSYFRENIFNPSSPEAIGEISCEEIANQNYPAVGQLWDRYICLADCNRLTNLVREFSRASEDNALSKDKLDNIFYPLMSYPIQSGCEVLKRFGGKFHKNKAWDGDKLVCLDDFKDEECLVYSFGLARDWTFEEIMANQRCTVKAFDPTVADQHLPGVEYHKMGLGDRDAPLLKLPVKTLKTLLAENGDADKVINYLKVDIEGAEGAGFPKWAEDGSLDNVRQIGVELHTTKWPVRDFINIVLILMKEGFKPISYMSNEAFGRKATGDYYRLMEVVFRRTAICNGAI